ncbi:MAG: helix-hairpin-helix domain-containing protein [Sphingobacteriales bacterium]
MKTFKLDLSQAEKEQLKKNRLKISRLGEFSADEIMVLLKTDEQKANEIFALIAFQSIPSIGPKFARDLISLGIYTINDLVDKDGPGLFNELERKQGFWTDPCVEDQFRLAIYYANHPGSNKNWWDFTADRKTYRAKHGYPAERPTEAWHEVNPVNTKKVE